jgi:hypothetical protein
MRCALGPKPSESLQFGPILRACIRWVKKERSRQKERSRRLGVSCEESITAPARRHSFS